MAAPVVIASGGGAKTSATTNHSIILPATENAGSLMLMAFRRSGDETGAVATPPSGWTEIGSGFGTTAYTNVFARVSTYPSDPFSTAVGTDLSVTSAYRWWFIQDWYGTIADGVGVVGAGGTSANPNPPNNTIPTDDGWTTNTILSIAVAAWNGAGATASSYPSGYSSGATHISNGARIASAEMDIAAFSEDPATFTLSTSADWTGLTILVRPIEGAGNTGSAAITEGADDVAGIAEQLLSGTAAILEDSDIAAIDAISINSGITSLTESPDDTVATGQQTAGGVGDVLESADEPAGLASQTNAADAAIQEDADISAGIGVQTVSADAAITEAGDSVSSVGQQTLSGTTAIDEGGDNTSSVGTQTLSGTAAVAEDADAVVATSSQTQSGSAAINEAADSPSATAEQTLSGTSAITEDADTPSIAAEQTLSGTAAVTEDSDVVVGTSSQTTSGSAAITENDDSVSGVASQQLSGTLSITEDNDDTSGIANQALSGTLSITEQQDNVVGDGNPNNSGYASILESSDSQTATAEQLLTGSLNITEADDVYVSFGNAAEVLYGTATITENVDAQISSATQLNSGNVTLTETSDTYSASGTQQNYGPLLCCCDGPCIITSDNFNAPDSNPPSGNWAVIDGEWEIFENRLRSIYDGPILTTVRQSPSNRPNNEYSIKIYAKLMYIEAGVNDSYGIICGYEDEDNFAWVQLDLVGTSMMPTFWKRTGGVDDLVMDITTHPAGVGFPIVSEQDTEHLENSINVCEIKICYSEEDWTVDKGASTESGYGMQIVGSEHPWTVGTQGGQGSLPSVNGMVGFFFGWFDNFAFHKHWEAKIECDYCSCLCISPNDLDDYDSLPEVLLCTFVPLFDPYIYPCLLNGATVTIHQVFNEGGTDLSPTKRIWCNKNIDEGTNTPTGIVCLLECNSSAGNLEDRLVLKLAVESGGSFNWGTIPAGGDKPGAYVTWEESTCVPLALTFGELSGPYTTCEIGYPSSAVMGIKHSMCITDSFSTGCVEDTPANQALIAGLRWIIVVTEA